MSILLNAPSLAGLEWLDCRYVKMGISSAIALASSRLKVFDLSCQGFKKAEWPALWSGIAAGKSSFEAVDLCATRLGDEGMKALAGWAGFDKCKWLNLDNTGISDVGLAVLVARNPLHLESLDLASNQISEAAKRALLASKAFPKLRRLRLELVSTPKKGSPLRKLADARQIELVDGIGEPLA